MGDCHSAVNICFLALFKKKRDFYMLTHNDESFNFNFTIKTWKNISLNN